MTSLTQALQILSISTALTASGGIATLSAFDVPEIQSQPASRSLPMIRWLFSRGSHIFPTAAFVSSAGFASLAYKSLPSNIGGLQGVLKVLGNGGPPSLYAAAAVLTLSIAPWTALVMIPTNFALIQKNEELGGARSRKSAAAGNKGGRSAEESVDGKGDVSQWTDVSGPTGKTGREGSEEQEREVGELLGRFKNLNWVRAGLIGVGGVRNSETIFNFNFNFNSSDNEEIRRLHSLDCEESSCTRKVVVEFTK
ncbi:hypothetical protein BDV96DRAFT_638654 [Lophiotrema nucula]|uniref:Uncharacterized protein n=1 Tax=Lophiotrema nucula TaxID=690887 RepID=A0A6A5YES0_9PLEO|nr:hypothetical protein BDV96DRAFT_638654 [Lophiotrema nucula]